MGWFVGGCFWVGLWVVFSGLVVGWYRGSRHDPKRAGEAARGGDRGKKKGRILARMPIGTGGLIMHMPAGIGIALVVVCVCIGFVISTTVILNGG